MDQTPTAPTFSRSQALNLGWSDSALTRAVRSGRLVRIRRGHFAVGDRSSAELDAVAASLARAGSVISHRSALIVHGIALVGPKPPVPELTVRPRGRVAVAGAHMHRATLLPEHVVVVRGLPVTSIARTLVDVARHRPTTTAVAAIDHALHKARTTVDELEDVLRTCRNWPRIRRAERAVRLADARAESPLESVSRLVLRWLRIPTPTLQAPIFDQFDHFTGRADFYWDQFGVVGEADGRDKYDGRDVLTGEKLRQEGFEELGLVVARWGWTDAVRHPRALEYRLRRAYERGALRDRSGFTRLWSVGGR